MMKILKLYLPCNLFFNFSDTSFSYMYATLIRFFASTGFEIMVISFPSFMHFHDRNQSEMVLKVPVVNWCSMQYNVALEGSILLLQLYKDFLEFFFFFLIMMFSIISIYNLLVTGCPLISYIRDKGKYRLSWLMHYVLLNHLSYVVFDVGILSIMFWCNLCNFITSLRIEIKDDFHTISWQPSICNIL